MRKKYGIWFGFNGQTCMEAGAWLKSAPVFVHPAWRGQSMTAVGRDGDYFATDGASEPYDCKMTVRTHLSQKDRVTAWLSGSGLLSISWQLDRACPARIEKSYQWKYVVPGRDPIFEAEIVFTCQPWFYLQPAHREIEITKSGADLYNPGTAAAQPTVAIIGDGSFTVSIGGQEIYMQNISGGIVIDSEFGNAYDLDETVLLNNNISGDLWEIQPGHNEVSWVAEPGSKVSQITILPKWRYKA